MISKYSYDFLVDTNDILYRIAETLTDKLTEMKNL